MSNNDQSEQQSVSKAANVVFLVTKHEASGRYFGNPVEVDPRQTLRDMRSEAAFYGYELQFVALRRSRDLIDFAAARERRLGHRVRIHLPAPSGNEDQAQRAWKAP